MTLRLTDGAAGLAVAKAKTAAILADDEDEDFVTAGEAAERLGISYETTMQLIRNGWLEGVGGTRGYCRVPADEVESYKREQMKLAWAWEEWE